MFDRATTLALAAIFTTLAIAHSPWWLAAVAVVAALAVYDRWARRFPRREGTCPRCGGRNFMLVFDP